MIFSVVVSDGELVFRNKVYPCAKQTKECKVCTANRSYAYCRTEEAFDTCGLLRLYGIIIAVLIPFSALIAIAAVLCENVASIGWNIMLGIVYM